MTSSTDVLVIGGGPAGASAAYWLARYGHDVTIVERKAFPREKTCGDGLTPRAVHQLNEMGLGDQLAQFHKYNGLRATGMGRQLELQWPSHPVYPQYGYVVRRRELDTMVARNAVGAGATLLEGHEALQPIVDRGFVRGAVVQSPSGEPVEIRARYVVVADGANSRFGRSLGTFRTREWPYGTAIRTYWETPRHAEPWIESALDVKDRNGNPMPGYGWIFPVGDGTVNIGVGLLSTFREFKSVNTTHLLDAYAHQVADRWEIDADHPECKATSGRIPMGGSVGPKAGPSYLVIGDAAGSVNPFNGEGIDYAYETARMAAAVLHEAIDAGDPTALQRYPSMLDEEYGEYFKVARLFARVIGRPALMRELTRAGMHSRTLMEWVLRIMANLLRPDELGPAELAYKAAANLVKLAPNA
ncbi:MAG: geranylgeranyl reductase family protein [Ilumatobacteraceae bacterium]|nr:geranylgeranyl reductase family protein [Ilumatobacteraceae bacterium]